MTEAPETEDNYDELQDEDEHLEWLSVSEILDDPDNLRETYDGIEDLAASIKAQGLIQPITVRRNSDGHYVILAGHRRKRALILAGILKTRVLVKHKDFLSEDVLANMIIENGHRTDLNAMEVAYGLKRMAQRENLSSTQLAQKVGRTQVWVSSRLRLLDLDPHQQQMVREGRMTLGEATRVGRLQSGAVRPGAKGKKGGGWFTSTHELAKKAENRCRALNHKTGGPNWVVVACGGCWEVVIRNDALTKAREQANESGHCGVCGSEVEKVGEGAEGQKEEG